jgi:hypothetical protein
MSLSPALMSGTLLPVKPRKGQTIAMNTTTSFVCATCGTAHDGYPTDQAYGLPDMVWAIPEDEREARARFDTDLCECDGHFFVRAVLKVPLACSESFFGWGLWVEVHVDDFWRYVDVYETDATGEPPYSAKIANAPKFYPDALGADVMMQFGTAKDRPTLYFQPDAMSALAIDQRDGMSAERHHCLLEALGYGAPAD